MILPEKPTLKVSAFAAALVLGTIARTEADDRNVVFGTNDAGVTKSIPTWGLDLAWLSENNVRRGVIFMGKDQTDVIRFSFTGDTPVVGGELTGAGLTEFDQRMGIVEAYTNPGTPLYLNNDTDDWNTNPYLVAHYNNGVDAAKWAELIAVTAQKCVDAGHPVLSVAPFNEPDHANWQGDVTRFGDVCWQLRNAESSPGVKRFPAFDSGASPFVRIMGANVLNNDQARPWGYDQLNAWGFLEEGNTHQLAGNMSTYIDFYETVEANGDLGMNDELHNVMEAMVGAEYGMDGGIWWGTAERARGEFVKASDGDRLAYAEHRPNWTAASVYRAPDGKIQAFVGESERQAIPTTYRFVSKDRPVFYDGRGPQRVFHVTTTGAAGYQTSDHHNAERVVNITWGDDVQPEIDGRYVIVAKHSGKVLDVNGASLSGGANIQQWTYFGNTNQQWDVEPVPSTTGGDYSYFTIRAAHSGQNLDLLNSSYNDGANVIQYGIGFGVNQQWFLDYAGDGYFYIRNKWSGKYLDVNGGVPATGDGANVQQWDGPGGTNQLWRFMPVDADPTDVTPPAPPTGVVASANEVSIQLGWNANGEGDLAGYTVMRSATSGGPYEIIARGLTSNSFTDNSANQNSPYYYVVKATDKSLNRSANSAQSGATPGGAPTLVAHLGFENHTDDGTGSANHATAVGSAAYTSGWVGSSALELDGTYHAILPAEVANHNQITIATWVRWNGGSDWQRIFDFGNGTSHYMYLSPKVGGGGLRFAIKNGGAEQQLNAPALAVGEWHHVAVTLGADARLYVNGVEAAMSGSLTIRPPDFKPALNLLGDSQFDADPLFHGSIDDFRIYNHALTAGDITALFSQSATVAHWDFEDGVAGEAFTPSGEPDGSGGSVDVQNGILMKGFNETNGPSWTSAVPPHGGTLAMRNADNAQDGYVTDGALHNWSPTRWTIECAVYLEEIAGWETLIGRDGSTGGSAASDFYLQNNGVDDRFRISIRTVGGNRWDLDGNHTVQTHTWYALAARSDGSTLSLWLDDGSGYQQIGSLDISAQSEADNALPASTFNWTFGRGWYNGGFVDHIDGRMDNIRFTAAALDPQNLIPLLPAPAAPVGLAATAQEGSGVGLVWNASDWAASYTVKRSESHGGPYTTIASGITGTNYDDGGLTPSETYYYVVSAENATGESTDSEEDLATTWSPAEEWRFAEFGMIENDYEAADGADPDRDGITNTLERAFGGDPNQPDRSVLPAVDPSQPSFSIVYQKAISANDLAFTVQKSTDLAAGSWTNATGTSHMISDDGTVQVIRFTPEAGAGPALFLRIMVD